MPAEYAHASANAPVGAGNPPDRSAARHRARVIVEGFGQLVEGQRQFAEEFGLPYERVFSDGFEAFKGREVRDVIRELLQGKGGGADELGRLLRDLADHQLALLCAVETVTRPPPEPVRFRSLATLLRTRAHPSGSSPLPRMAAAYARCREASAPHPVDKEQQSS